MDGQQKTMPGQSEGLLSIQSREDIQQEDEDIDSATVVTGVSFANPTKPRTTRFDFYFKVFIAILVLLNVVVIGFSIRAITAGRGAEECQVGRGRGRKVVAPLPLPCEKVLEKEGEEEGEEEGGWRRFKNGDSGQDLCWPLDHRRLATAVGQIYRTARTAKGKEFLKKPPEPYASLFDEPDSIEQTVSFANRYKPSGHVTGVQRFDPMKNYGDNSCRTADSDMWTVCDWPLRVEPYRSMTAGYVRRLTWGLVVPITGLYRIHTNFNFYFNFSYLHNSTDLDQVEEIPVIHQLSRYHAKNGKVTVLTERNQTITGSYCDGLTSFLVTLAQLDVGDVISVDVSYRSASAMLDPWHSEGLFLVR